MGQKIYDYIIKNCLIKDHWQEWKEVAEYAAQVKVHLARQKRQEKGENDATNSKMG